MTKDGLKALLKQLVEDYVETTYGVEYEPDAEKVTAKGRVEDFVDYLQSIKEAL